MDIHERHCEWRVGMYRKCATEVSAQHQRQITDSLLELMQKIPYEDITVTQLCEASGVTRRIFYHLFNNKTGALYALIDHTILGLESYRPDLSRPALRSFLYWKEQKKLLDALRDNQMNGLLLERMIESVMNEGYDVRYWLKTRGWENEKDAVVFCLTGFMGLTYRWYYSNFRESPEEMAALLEKFMTTPLAGNKAP